MLDITLTLPQTEFSQSPEEYVAAVAGFGSGKTESAMIRILATMSQYPTIDMAYLAPTYPLIRDIFYPKITETLTAANIKHHINRSDNVVHIQGRGRIICRTMDKPEMIVGWQVGDAVMDEFDVLPTTKALSVFRKVSARCRQKFPDKKVNQKFITTTPEGFKATYKLFKKEPLDGSRLIQMSTHSNAHNLPEGYIDGLRKQYPPNLIDAYLDGKFVNLVSGSVYYAFDRGRHHTTYLPKPREVLHVGMDFNVYKMAAAIGVIRHDKETGKKRIHIVDEVIDLRDTPDMIDHLKNTYPDHKIVVYPDASGKSASSRGATESDHKLLKQAGFTLRVHNSNPLVRDRVTSVNNAFDKDNLQVNVERCPFITEALEQQVYGPGNVPLKEGELEHRLDALGYLVVYLFPVVKHLISERMIGGT